MAEPAPYVVTPTWLWDGDTGSWSTFSIEVGTPPQSFRVLPSLSGSEISVLIPQGCESILAGISDCGDLRGINNASSRGFQSNSSSTWDVIGIYQLNATNTLFGTDDNGVYGLDTVTIGNEAAANSASLQHQTVAGIATINYWLGSFGLGISSSNFSTEDVQRPSLLSSMKDQSMIPSLSFGYTAGASYIDPPVHGSLVLGGYDSSRFSPSSIRFSINNMESLEVQVRSIIGSNTFNATSALIRSPAADTVDDPTWTFQIDSSVSDIWLPRSACDLFAAAFNLTNDDETDLYLIGDEAHERLITRDAEVIFTIGGMDDIDSTINIVLPYSAFSLNATIPVYNSSTRYFPIRVAGSEAQYTLGRAFLQEAYIFVDWERQNFTIGQALHQSTTPDIVPVLSPVIVASTIDQSSDAMSTGTIAGIAVGCVLFLALLIGGLVWSLRTKKRRQQARTSTLDFRSDVKIPEPLASTTVFAESMSSPIHELQSPYVNDSKLVIKPPQELAGSEVVELQGNDVNHNELEAPVGTKTVQSARNTQVHEMP